MTDLLYADETYAIIGACMEVHRHLGHGFLEAVYSEALMAEFEERDIPYEINKELTIEYKGSPLLKRYYADFVCFDKILIELKAVEKIAPPHIAQVLNYLKATKMSLGIIANFGEASFNYKRIIL